MNKRLTQIRKSLNMTMGNFGERLGVTKAAISKLEKGERNLTEQMIKAICREFEINEEWLRTGKGEMKIPINPDDRYATNVGKLQRIDDETIIRWVNAIAETNPEVLKQIEEFIKKILDIKE